VAKSGFFYAAILMVPAAALAAGAFDGTWKVSLNDVQLSKKPLSFSLGGGAYTCASCVPSFTVKADGTDQKTAGPDFDSIAVTVSGSDTCRSCSDIVFTLLSQASFKHGSCRPDSRDFSNE
jgi:hypothetical protein